MHVRTEQSSDRQGPTPPQGAQPIHKHAHTPGAGGMQVRTEQAGGDRQGPTLPQGAPGRTLPMWPARNSISLQKTLKGGRPAPCLSSRPSNHSVLRGRPLHERWAQAVGRGGGRGAAPMPQGAATPACDGIPEKGGARGKEGGRLCQQRRRTASTQPRRSSPFSSWHSWWLSPLALRHP